MNTMTLLHATEKTESLLPMTDEELESWFSSAGLAVEVVDHCGVADCDACFPGMSRRAEQSPARAA